MTMKNGFHGFNLFHVPVIGRIKTNFARFCAKNISDMERGLLVRPIRVLKSE